MANHPPAAASRGGGPRRLVGAADDRHAGQHPLVAGAARTRSGSSGRTTSRWPSTASPAAISRRRSRPAIPVIAKANSRIPARRGCLPRKRKPRPAGDGPAARHRPADLPHRPRGRRAPVSDPRTGATGYTGSRTGRAQAEGRRRRGRQADLPGTVQRQSGRDPAGRPERARTAAGRRVHDQLPDGHRPVLHEPGLVLLVKGEATEQLRGRSSRNASSRAGRHAAVRRRRIVAARGHRSLRRRRPGPGPAARPAAARGYNIYGHFAEHLGRCIYEGIWVGEDSPSPTRAASATRGAALRRRSRSPCCAGRAAASPTSTTGRTASARARSARR
jgi:hypothetical protein